MAGVMGRCCSQNAKKLPETRLVETPSDERDARAAISAGPPGQGLRRAEHLLFAVQQNGSGQTGDIYDRFDLQRISAGKADQKFQPGAQVLGCNGMFQNMMEGSDPFTKVEVCMLIAVSLMKDFSAASMMAGDVRIAVIESGAAFREGPALHVHRLAFIWQCRFIAQEACEHRG